MTVDEIEKKGIKTAQFIQNGIDHIKMNNELDIEYIIQNNRAALSLLRDILSFWDNSSNQ